MSRNTPEPSSETYSHEYDRLFNADSVAIIGASTDHEKITGRPQFFLEKHGYEGDVYPVNPKYDEINGLTCYDSVLDVPDEIDVALLLVPSRFIPDVLAECGEKGIPFAVVIGSGFGEIGEEGKELEAELLEIGREHGIRIIGPNTLGIMGFKNNNTLCFSSILDERDEIVGDGEIAFVSQSGAFAGMLFLITQRMGIGTKYWASTGNEIDVDALELMEFMIEDPEVSMVFGYIESFEDPDLFETVAEKARKHETPVLVMKVGQSDRAQEAVSSHTGKMAGDYDVYEAIFKEYGIIELQEITALKDVMETISVLDTFPRAEDRWAVLSPSGGAGALIADAINREGMALAEFEKETTDLLSGIVPEYGSVLNPVDTTANIISDYSLYEDAFRALLEDDNVDILLLQFGNSGPKQAAAYEDLITSVAGQTDKLILAVFTGGKPDDALVESYRHAGIPTFTDPVRAVRTIRMLGRFGTALDAPATGEQASSSSTVPIGRPIDTAELSNWDQAKKLLEAYDIPHADGRVVDSPTEAVSVAEELGYPVVMKVSAPSLEHKTEAGGIELGVDSPATVEATYKDLTASVAEYDADIDLDGVLVQESFDDGVEVIIGITRTDLGPVMMFGTGGTFVEVLDDVSYQTLPITPKKAQDLIDETNAGKILSGHRGETYNVDSLVDLMTNASRLYEEVGINELDLNPVMVDDKGATVVDFLAK